MSEQYDLARKVQNHPRFKIQAGMLFVCPLGANWRAVKTHCGIGGLKLLSDRGLASQCEVHNDYFPPHLRADGGFATLQLDDGATQGVLIRMLDEPTITIGDGTVFGGYCIVDLGSSEGVVSFTAPMLGDALVKALLAVWNGEIP